MADTSGRKFSITEGGGPGIDDAVLIEDKAMENMGRRLSAIQWDRKGSAAKVELNDLIDEAKEATEKEHTMGLLQAIKTYPKAVGWSVLASTALVMEGYDLVVIYNFFGFPAFAKKYGLQLADGTYSVPAAWQSGLSNGANCGEIVGLMFAGILADRYGYRKVIGGALIMVVCFIFITFFAPSVEVLLVGEILCGLPWGVFQTITTAYAAEVTPVALRPYLCTYVNLCWVLGQVIGSGVLRGLVDRTDQWGYRIPFALQWMWPIPLLVGITLAPESPWWLVRKGRLAEAEHALERLTSRTHDPDFDTQKTIAMIIHTNEIEKELTAGTSYWDCFKGTDLRRTEICCMTWMIQTLCGSGLMGYSSYFYEQAGLSPTYSFDLTMGQYAIGAVGVFTAWALMPWFGRRSLYLWGLAALFVLLLIIGFISLAPASPGRSWGIGSMLLVYTFVYDTTVGPVCYSLVAELSSTRLRQKTIVLARNAYNVIGIINNILTPHMLNPTAWAWGAKAGFFWAGICFLSLLWTYFRLPEPKNRTYAELDILFERRVPAKKFSKTIANPFRGDTLEAGRHGSIVKVKSQESDEYHGHEAVSFDEKMFAAKHVE